MFRPGSPVNWDRFLASLRERSCQVIQSQGRVGACSETLAGNFVGAAREAALEASISNIDHRRVRNRLVYFARDPKRYAVLKNPDRDWQPGDIVVWNLMPSPKLLHHIGIVSDKRGESGDWLVIHHLPPSGSEDDRLHHWEILAHIRPLL